MTEIGRLLGSGKEAEVFEYGALALKLYKHAAAKASAFRRGQTLRSSKGFRCRRQRFMRLESSTGVGAW